MWIVEQNFGNYYRPLIRLHTQPMRSPRSVCGAPGFGFGRGRAVIETPAHAFRFLYDVPYQQEREDVLRKDVEKTVSPRSDAGIEDGKARRAQCPEDRITKPQDDRQISQQAEDIIGTGGFGVFRLLDEQDRHHNGEERTADDEPEPA
jgi:hypothetical protein